MGKARGASQKRWMAGRREGSWLKGDRLVERGMGQREGEGRQKRGEPFDKEFLEAGGDGLGVLRVQHQRVEPGRLVQVGGLEKRRSNKF